MCVPDLANMINNAETEEAVPAIPAAVSCSPAPSPGAKGCKDELHLTISSPYFLFPFPVRQLD